MKKILVFLLTFFMVGFSMAKELKIKSNDGFNLVGFLEYPEIKKDKYPVIVFAHQFGTTHVIWSKFAKEVRKKGYATLLIDLRGHGLSIVQNGKENKIVFKIEYNSLLDLINFFKKSWKKVRFDRIPDDITLWVDYLIEKEKIDPENVILMGASLGGISIIPVVANQDIKAIISISPGSENIPGKENVQIALASYMNPVLYVASYNDSLGSNKTVNRLMKITNKGTAIFVSGSGHGVILLDRVKDYIFTFLDKLEKEEK